MLVYLNVYDSHLLMTANQCCLCQRFGVLYKELVVFELQFRVFARHGAVGRVEESVITLKMSDAEHMPCPRTFIRNLPAVVEMTSRSDDDSLIGICEYPDVQSIVAKYLEVGLICLKSCWAESVG